MEKEKHKTISVESIDKVLKYLSIFDKKGYSFSTWESGKTKNGISDFPFCNYSREVNEFQHVLYEEGFIIDFDWPNWQDKAEQFYSNPKLLKTADLDILQKLLTTHIRKDRLCEGHLDCVLKDGHITAILRQLKEIRKETASG